MDGQLMDDSQEVSTWDNYKVTFDSYQKYLEQKGKDKRKVDFIDLLYASNYKGGSGSIQEDLSKQESKDKLAHYIKLLKDISDSFEGKDLRSLDADGLKKLVDYAGYMIDLCRNYHIKGLGVPYCSALFHLQFPNLFPVIDRNVLLGLNIIKPEILQKSGQVWKIEKYYIPLLEKMYVHVRENQKSLRDADKDLFNIGRRIYEKYKQQTNL